MQRSSLWRGAVVTALAAAAVGAGIGPAAAASAASPAITITVSSAIPKISGDVVVQYHYSKYDTVTVKGTVSAATSGEVAELYAQPFPYAKAPQPVPGQSKTLPASTKRVTYKFEAVPTLATRYSVRLLASSSATSAVTSSATKIVYVVTKQPYYGLTPCNTAVCHETIRVYTILPASAYKTESAKRWYFYLGVSLSAKSTPLPPEWIYLDSGAKIGKVKRISATEFERIISFSFRVNNDGFYLALNFCSKDTESKDGINLPGHHSCGASKVKTTIPYLG
jgi:hypothetical protein